MRDALPAFTGGTILIGVLGQPFKCPPAPFEGAFLLHDQLVERGIREQAEIRVIAPMSAPVPVTPRSRSASSTSSRRAKSSTSAQNTRRRTRHPRKEAVLESGERLSYDLFVGIPIHRVPAVVEESGLAEDGWVAVDRDNLMTPFPDVYAVGDIVEHSDGEGGRVRGERGRRRRRRHRGAARGERLERRYEGEGNCYLEFGGGRVAKVRGQLPRRPVPVAHGRRPVRGARGREGGLRPDAARALVRPGLTRVASFAP